MARLESTKRAKLKTAKQHQPSQKSKSLTCCYLLPRFWVTPYLVPIGTVDLKKKVSIHKLFLSFPNKGGCSHIHQGWEGKFIFTSNVPVGKVIFVNCQGWKKHIVSIREPPPKNPCNNMNHVVHSLDVVEPSYWMAYEWIPNEQNMCNIT